MATLIPLASCLPRYTKLRGNFGPADPEVDCVIDKRIKLRICVIPRTPGTLESLQDV